MDIVLSHLSSLVEGIHTFFKTTVSKKKDGPVFLVYLLNMCYYYVKVNLLCKDWPNKS